MSGKFKKSAKQFRLVFPEDHELHGLEVLMKSMSIGAFLSMTDKFAAVEGTAGTLGVQRPMFKFFAANLVEWNLTDEDDKDVPPVLARCTASGQDAGDSGFCPAHDGAGEPCAVAGVLAQEVDFIMTLYTAWQEAMAGVGSPLSSRSPSGTQSLEASIPMDA